MKRLNASATGSKSHIANLKMLPVWDWRWFLSSHNWLNLSKSTSKSSRIRHLFLSRNYTCNMLVEYLADKDKRWGVIKNVPSVRSCKITFLDHEQLQQIGGQVTSSRGLTMIDPDIKSPNCVILVKKFFLKIERNSKEKEKIFRDWKSNDLNFWTICIPIAIYLFDQYSSTVELSVVYMKNICFPQLETTEAVSDITMSRLLPAALPKWPSPDYSGGQRYHFMVLTRRICRSVPDFSVAARFRSANESSQIRGDGP